MPVYLSGDLPALVYLIEQRSSHFVHPTLHRRTLQMADALDWRFNPYGLRLYLDKEVGRFDAKRGTQDIALLA